MPTSPSTDTLADLRARLPELMLRDERRLARRLDGVRKVRDAEAKAAAVTQIAGEVEAAERRLQRRQATVPAVRYPQELPISRRRDDIAAAIRDHQVVIVAGETGSGKTTQLPKICLELGRGVRGTIGHTQPRRLAARTVAERVAEELGTELGRAVGYQVRFTAKAGDDTLVKLMTDGILLAEIGQDRLLRRYDTLIIDEAHERSLNIDFILGYLKQLLPRRPDLKVIITSATIDPERFAQHFDDAPIIEVSGRTYPVEVRYRPLDLEDEEEPRDQIQAIVEACDELALEASGDVLVFLSGEREIRDTADALRKRYANAPQGTLEVLPLYARLSAAEQHRVFQPHTGRRIVLATNVAETSLTVPGIRYVVDPGTARISRYSNRTKVQRLPIEPVSQASARQRAGRCGRLSDGICIRLYSEEDFESRPAFTEPEILRTNLASVILQMTALGLGDVAAFPFLDPPDRRSIADGVNLLVELGALDPSARDEKERLTTVGRSLSQLPIDPRLARMILEAGRNGSVRELLVLTAALSIQDPRERPSDQRDVADAFHARFADQTSDFLAFLNLWRYVKEKQDELSSSAFRRLCRTEHLNYLRIREWQDLESQLRQLVKPLGIRLNQETTSSAEKSASAGGGSEEHIHQALLSGLLSHIGVKDEAGNEYQGARGAKFAVFPGSALFKKPPRWVMSAELVETSRLWARVNARIDPAWAEPLAEHLVKRTYSEPHWERKAGAVVGYEKVMLYGVVIVPRRKVQYSRVDPELSRELFIRHALVEGDWTTHHKFFHENRELLEDVEELEHRARRRDIVVDDETLFAFYDERIPADVVSGRHFDSWWKNARHERPDLLTFDTDLLTTDAAGAVTQADYPDSWPVDDLDLRLTYQFEPGSSADGVTVHIPIEVLNQVEPDGFDWQVPGLRPELVTALIKALPKPLRRSFVPAPDTAREALTQLPPSPSGQPFVDALARVLHRARAVPMAPSDFDLSKVPDHLRMTFRVLDEKGRLAAEGKDLDELKVMLQKELRKTMAAAASSIERTGLTAWPGGELPRTFEQRRSGHVVTGYPALVDEGTTVALKVLPTPSDQTRAMWTGNRRLLLLGVPSPTSFVQRHLANRSKLVLSQNPDGSVADLLDDVAAASVDWLVAQAGGPAWDEAAFAALRERVRSDLIETVFEVVGDVEKVLEVSHRVSAALKSTTSLALTASLVDARDHLAQLLPRGFVTSTGRKQLPDLLRYLRAIERRLEKLPTSPQRDRQNMDTVRRVTDEYEAALAALPPGHGPTAAHDAVRWLIEELRVSLFAQELGTAQPVSEKRLLKAIDALYDQTS